MNSFRIGSHRHTVNGRMTSIFNGGEQYLDSVMNDEGNLHAGMIYSRSNPGTGASWVVCDS
jgi:hypothetical protein